MVLSALSPILRLAGARQLTREILLSMAPEAAHRATIAALRLGAVPPSGEPDPPALGTEIAGLALPNPIGMAAGFDKNAEVALALCRMGFGYAEAGTVTPLPQPGNPKPRVFRLEAAEAVVNRLGFNSDGHEAAAKRLRAPRLGATVGVNIGANKQSSDFVADYVAGVKRFAPLADYLTVNISSPNTPGLRDLQAGEALKRLLGEVLAERSRAEARVPVFLKLAPDLDEVEMDEIAAVIGALDLDGLVMSNTTVTRPGVAGLKHAEQTGGLSGRPLFNLSTMALARMRLRVGPAMPIIGVGGIHSASSAIAKFAAGANALQLYTALIFHGLELIADIKVGLVAEIRRRDATSISALSGTDVDGWASGRVQL
ncbi:MAG TPA: quinone-dependent dihydroorotate dehydrogenase [Devosiaceae bacterium]|nr:quinone-dependent dihydroorotate dehydrogenase [Devosiaceae bacterium]